MTDVYCEFLKPILTLSKITFWLEKVFFMFFEIFFLAFFFSSKFKVGVVAPALVRDEFLF